MSQEELSASLEDYLEAIYQLCQANPHSHAHSNQIAEDLAVSKSSVSWALSQLSEKGLINYEPYAPITLKKKGEKLAAMVSRRHGQLKDFLIEVLNLEEDLAEANACRMEHIVDRQIVEKMSALLDFLAKTPQAEKILRDFADEHAGNQNNTTHESDFQGQEIPKTTKARDVEVLDRLVEILKESHRQLSTCEFAVAREFMSCENHRTISDIHKAARKKNQKVTRQIVSDVMNLLCEHKIARALQFEDEVVFEHLHPDSHHDHLYCVKCGTIVEFFDPKLEALQFKHACNANFRPLMHRLDIRGVCQDCIKMEGRIRSLDKCLTGERVKIIRVVAETKTKKRITEMGLLCSTCIEVLSNKCSGNNMLIVAGATRIMVDRDIAAKIKVTPVRNDLNHTRQWRHRKAHQHPPDRKN